MGEIRLDDCCRLCLKEGFSLTNIFLQKSTAGDPLFRILNSIYELTISENDGLPSQICYPCMWRMIEFDACKKNVRSAEVEIRRLINQIRPHMNKVSSDGAVVMNRGTKLVGANEVGIEHVTVHSEVPIKEEIDIEEWEMPVETSMEAPETCQHFEEGDEDDYHEIESTELAPEEISAEEFEGNGNEHVFCQPLREGPNLSEVVSSLYVDDNEDVVNSTFEDRICIDNTTGISVKQEVSGRMFEEEDVTDTELKTAKETLKDEGMLPCRIRKKPLKFKDTSESKDDDEFIRNKRSKINHNENLRVAPPEPPALQEASSSGSDEKTAGGCYLSSLTLLHDASLSLMRSGGISSRKKNNVDTTNTKRQSHPKEGQEVSALKGVLVDLQEKLDTMVENQQQELMMLKMLEVRVNCNEEMEDLLPAPLNTSEELNEFCQKLEDKEFSRKMILYLSSFGGRNLGDCVRQMLRKVGHNRLWAKYSLKGRKGKLPLQNLNICKVLAKACLNNFVTAKMVDIEAAIAETIKYAPKRLSESENPR